MMESWRLFFPTAAALAVGGLSAWGAQTAGVPLGILPREHGAFMVWGVLGSGIFGFLLTAYAKQNGAPLPGRPFLLLLWAAQLAGAIGLLFGVPWISPFSWIFLLLWSADVARTSLRERWDPTTAAVPFVLASGLVGLLVHVAGGNGTGIGVNTLLVPLALAILDRVLPFFSARVTPGYAGVRLPWFIGPVLVASWLRSSLVSDLATLALLGLLARQWWGWRPWPAIRTPMIAILHLGVAWLAVGWLLSLTGASDSIATHALAIGGLGCLFLGISMRVVRGHAGMPLVLGRVGAAVILIGQVAAILRIVGLPLVYPAVALASAFLLWFLRFSLMCLKVDNAR